jgi:hypothetical protein
MFGTVALFYYFGLADIGQQMHCKRVALGICSRPLTYNPSQKSPMQKVALFQ